MAFTEASALSTVPGLIKSNSGAALSNIKVLGILVFVPPRWFAAIDGAFPGPPAVFNDANNYAKVTLRDGSSSGEIKYNDSIKNTAGCTSFYQINFPSGLVFSSGVYLDGAITQLSASITSASLTVPVVTNGASGFYQNGGVVIGSEVIIYQSKSPSAFSVLNILGIDGRAYEGTAAAAHSSGSSVSQFMGHITLFYEQL